MTYYQYFVEFALVMFIIIEYCCSKLKTWKWRILFWLKIFKCTHKNYWFISHTYIERYNIMDFMADCKKRLGDMNPLVKLSRFSEGWRIIIAVFLCSLDVLLAWTYNNEHILCLWFKILVKIAPRYSNKPSKVFKVNWCRKIAIVLKNKVVKLQN